jgi:hypothetical protein
MWVARAVDEEEMIMTEGPPLESPGADWSEQQRGIELDEASHWRDRAPLASPPLEADEADVQEQTIEVPGEEEYLRLVDDSAQSADLSDEPR